MAKASSFDAASIVEIVGNLRKNFEKAHFPELKPIAFLYVARIQGLDPHRAGELLRTATLTSGWAMLQGAEKSEVCAFVDSFFLPKGARVGSAEAVDAEGRSFRVSADGNGSLSLWISGEDVETCSGVNSEHLVCLTDLLVEVRNYLRCDHPSGEITYAIYWQSMPGFGFRPRFFSFRGFVGN